MDEILTVKEVAALLKVSTQHVYEMTQARTRSGDIRKNPLPCVHLGSSLRFRRSDVESWLQTLATKIRD